MVFYAKFQDEIVGTALLFKKNDSRFELGKMAICSHVQGNKVGTILLECCLHILKQKKVEKCILYSNTKLESAIHLYWKYGFVEVSLEPGFYERADIKTEKYLANTDNDFFQNLNNLKIQL